MIEGGGGLEREQWETMPNDLSGPASCEAAAGAVGGGRRNMEPPGWPSWTPGPEPGGQAARGSGGGRNGSPVMLPPRCGAIPLAPPPGWADGDDGDHGTRAVARSNAGDGDPLRNNNATASANAGEADDAGMENNDHGSDNGDNDKNNDKWGRGA